jgi:hypothetical protein
MKTLVRSCGYFSNLHDSKLLVKEAKVALKNVDYDTMVGIGLSGTLAIAKLSCYLDKHVLYLRKDKNTHSFSLEEGVIGEKWIFVDDFMSFGGTFNLVFNRITALFENENYKSEFVGAYFYQDSEKRKRGFYPVTHSVWNEFLPNAGQTT